MDFLKKWIGCIVSFIAGVCGLALSATVGMKSYAMIDATAIGRDKTIITDEVTKAFKVLTDKDLYTKSKQLGTGDEFMTMKVFAIITLVISVLLIAYAIVMLLKNLNVIKFESRIFDIVGICLFALLLVATIGLLVSSNAYAGAMEDSLVAIMKKATASVPAEYLPKVVMESSVKIGFYQPAMLVISIISTLVFGIFTFLKRKSA